MKQREQITRHALVTKPRGMDEWQDMEQQPDGEYVLYSDHLAAAQQHDDLLREVRDLLCQAKTYGLLCLNYNLSQQATTTLAKLDAAIGDKHGTE